MAGPLTETERMINESALRAYAAAWRDVLGKPEPQYLEMLTRAERIGRAARRLRQSALERSEG